MDLQSKVNQLIEEHGQNDQRTDAWHTKRGEMLTASEIYKALPDATPAQKHELIISKLVPRQRTDGPGPRALVWGTRFEPIAKDIYCKVSGIDMDIVDTTCIPHPTVSFLGASPDGIIVTKDPTHERYGRLVEFKCPISRSFSDESAIPTAYYHQMQLQMECTTLKLCEFIEFQFKVLSYSEWMDTNADYKGFYAVDDADMNVKYKNLDDDRNPADWRSEVLETTDDWNIVYWILDKHCVKLVKHEEDWLEKNLPSFTEVWNVIREHRKNNTLPEHPKEKTTLTL